jgi:PAS domain S-box-containing protein
VKVEYKIAAAFSVAFIALGLVGTLTYRAYASLVDRDRWVVHTYQVLGQLDQIFDSISEMESGGRGYLLTGRKEYLQPYQSGIDSVGTRIDELQRLVADNPAHLVSIETLRTQVNRAIANLHEPVEARRAGGLAAVLPMVGTEGKEDMDQLRFTLAAMRKRENALREQRTKQSERSANETRNSFFALVALGMLAIVAFYFVIRHDLADRRRKDEALRKSDLRFRRMMESAPDPMMICDEAGKIQIVNTQAEQMFGYTRAEFSDFALEQLLQVRERPSLGESLEGDPVSQQARDRAFQDLQAAGAQYNGVRKNGETFPLDLTRSPLEIGDEHLVITALRDRTEQQQAEDALRRYSFELARSNAELERFAYVASHDLQEPLRMVSSYTQLLSRRYKGKLDATADEFIAYAVDGASRMQRLINDLLALSRVGTQARPSEPVDTDAILRRVLTDLGQALESAGAAIVSPSPLPTVLGDSTQIGQLFQNLISNALKFRGTEPPRIEIGATPTDDGKFWKFSVADNGIGIETQYFERIFVIFQRLHAKQDYPGTGIGLAICKKIVERVGGHLWVESEIGRGTTFYFTLPASP